MSRHPNSYLLILYGEYPHIYLKEHAFLTIIIQEVRGLIIFFPDKSKICPPG